MLSKQEFYEGAALRQLAQSGYITAIFHQPPFFVVNGRFRVLLKYSTRGRSPWGFTFSPKEQESLASGGHAALTVVGLVCGSDGIASIRYDEFREIAALRAASLHIACYRAYNELYEVNGPDGRLARKVSPSSWQRLLQTEATE